MFAEFEEKEYERYFNNHLVVVNNQCWSPGQVLEGRIGYDGAAMVVPDILFETLYFRRLRRGDLRRGIKLDSGFVNKVFDIFDRRLPPYRFNLFAQHKRPEYISRSDGNEWPSWHQKYYRFEINPSQNSVLCKLESVCGAASIVTYCCPAFHTLDDLWSHNTSGTIIKNTNYAPPSRLSQHHYYSFVEPGGKGKGHSEVSDISGKTLEEMISETSKQPEVTARSLILTAGKGIKEAVAAGSGNISLVRRVARDLIGDGDGGGKDEGDTRKLIEAVAHIIALRFVFGTSLFLMNGDDKP